LIVSAITSADPRMISMPFSVIRSWKSGMAAARRSAAFQRATIAGAPPR
jgi:hypothetical protein